MLKLDVTLYQTIIIALDMNQLFVKHIKEWLKRDKVI